MVLSYAVCMNAANAYGTGYVETGSPGPTLRSVAKSVPGSHSTRVKSRIDCKCSAHLHPPVGHVVHAISHAAEDAVEVR